MTSIAFIIYNIRNIKVQLTDIEAKYDNQIDLKLDKDYSVLKLKLQYYEQVLKDLEKLSDIEADIRLEMLNGGKIK